MILACSKCLKLLNSDYWCYTNSILFRDHKVLLSSMCQSRQCLDLGFYAMVKNNYIILEAIPK